MSHCGQYRQAAGRRVGRTSG